MKVGVLGTGGVGAALGKQLNKSSFEVKYGSRNPGAEKTLLSKQPGTTAATHEEVVEWADAIVLAVTSPNDKAAIKEMAALVQGAVGKPVLDATNPLDTNYYCQLAGITSVGEELQALVGDSVPIYKAFNTIGKMHFEDPTLIHPNLTMLYAGPAEHQAMVDEIIRGVKFSPFRVGPIHYARNLEAMAEMWIHMAVPGIPHTDVKLDGNFAFELVRKE